MSIKAMADCPNLIDEWVRQLQSADTRALIELAAKQGRRVQVVLSTGDKGRPGGVKVTAS